MSVVLGIDIGGSGIKGAPVDITTGKLVGERYQYLPQKERGPMRLLWLLSNW